ncbi:MAG: hypothetical protein CMM00_09375 [Rhodopirellula sp.]|nr:hypothetical protein [Rhodopirellula sp.]
MADQAGGSLSALGPFFEALLLLRATMANAHTVRMVVLDRSGQSAWVLSRLWGEGLVGTEGFLPCRLRCFVGGGDSLPHPLR